MEAILDFLKGLHPLSIDLQNYLMQALKEKHYPKKALVLKEGEVCKRIYFVTKGLLRCYYIDDGIETSSWFMKANDIVISVESFYNQEKSYEYIQALEDTTVQYIEYNDLQFIYRTYPEFNVIGRLLTEKYYALSEQRLYALRIRKAVDRYLFLLTKHPDLIQLIPAKYLASYLGISKETYSRLKRKI